MKDLSNVHEYPTVTTQTQIRDALIEVQGLVRDIGGDAADLLASATKTTVTAPVNAVRAALTSGLTDAALTFTAKSYVKAEGEAISVEILAFVAEETLAATAVGNRINIQLGNGSTATAVAAACEAVPAVKALVTTTAGGTGAGAVVAAAAANLTGGVDATPGPVNSMLVLDDGSMLYIKVSEVAWKQAALSNLS